MAEKFNLLMNSEGANNFFRNFARKGISSTRESKDDTVGLLTEFLVYTAETAANNGVILFKGSFQKSKSVRSFLSNSV